MPTSAVRDVNLASAARLRSGSISSLPRSPESVNSLAAQERSQSEYAKFDVCGIHILLLVIED